MSPALAPLQIPVGCDAIRIGFRTPNLKRELDARGRVALARELGMTVIEPQCNADRDLGSVAEAEELRRAADAVGVAIPSVGCALPITAGTDEEVGERLDAALAIGRALGVRLLLCGIPQPPPEVPQQATWALAIPRLRRIADACAGVGIRFAIEPDHGTFIHTLERLQRVVGEVGHPNCGANFDACNLYVGGSDPVAAVGQLAGRIASGHLKDGIFQTQRRGEVPMGTGEVPWRAIFQAMIRAGVACPMYLEHCETVAGVRAAAQHIAGVVAEVTAAARAATASARSASAQRSG